MDLLEGVGVHGTVAHNGVETASAVTETEFDAVLMDIQPPEMGGVEATEKIRSDGRFAKLPILAVTAHAVKPMAEDVDSQLTAAFSITGTRRYVAPEMLVEGQGDSRSDLYALGCVAYWLLCGCLVFEGENPVQVLMHHVQTPPTPPSKMTELAIPASLEEVVMACLQKKPEDRPQNADELWRRLGEIHFDRPWTPDRAEKWWRTHLPEIVEKFE